mgnify:CR=1 FL=1
MALIIVLSVFNGLEVFIQGLYSNFDPQLKVVPVEGKSFHFDETTKHKLESIEGVAVVTEIIEDNAFIRYTDKEMVVTIKGVGENYQKLGLLQNNIVEGEFKLRQNEKNFAVIGRGVQYSLSLDVDNDFYALQVYYPKRDARSSSFNIQNMVNRKLINTAGIFAIEKQYDIKYVIVPISFAEELMQYDGKRTSLEISVLENARIQSVESELQKQLGSSFKVLNQDEQHATLLKVLKIEKLFVYVAFSFILFIASFNIFFSLVMLVIEKKKDIAVLYAMGAGDSIIKRIFFLEGAIIAVIGSAIGMVLAFILLWLQQEYGFIGMGMETSLIQAYPVKMNPQDFLVTGITILIITIGSSLRPARSATKWNIKESLG